MLNSKLNKRLFPILMMILVLLMNTGCGGGGGSSTAVTGGTTVVPQAMIAGKVEFDTAVAGPSLAPQPAANVTVGLYQGTSASRALPEVKTDASGFFTFSLPASLLNQELDIRINTGAAVVKNNFVLPEQDKTVFQTLSLNSAKTAVNSVLERKIAKSVVPFDPNTASVVYTTYFETTQTQPDGITTGEISGFVDNTQVQFVLNGSIVSTSNLTISTTATTSGYRYSIQNVLIGTGITLKCKRTTDNVEISSAQLTVAKDLVTAGVNFNFEEVSPELTIAKVSGDQQTGTVSVELKNPLIVKITQKSTGAAVVGKEVNFQVSNGFAGLSAPTVVTDVNGYASVVVTLTANSAPVTVVASLKDFPSTNVSFSVIVFDPLEVTGRPTATLLDAEASQRTVKIQFSESVTGADLTSNYRISFDGSTFSLLPGDSLIAYDTNLRQATITVGNGVTFSSGTSVYISLSNIIDLESNATSPALDYRIGSILINDNVAPSATIYSVQANLDTIIINFSEAVLNAGVVTNYLVSRDGFVFTPLSTPATATYSSDTRKVKLTLNGVVDIQSGDSVYVKAFSITDIAGNTMGGSSGSVIGPFAATLGDVTPPTASLTSADDQSQVVEVQYSEAVNENSAASISNYRVIVGGITNQLNLNLATVTYDATSLKATITFNTNFLVAQSSIAVEILNMLDTAGNAPTVNPYITNSFTVEDKTRPTMEIISADDFSQTIVLQVSEKMNPSGMAPHLFELSIDGGTTWTTLSSSYVSTPIYDDTTQKVTFQLIGDIELLGGNQVAVRVKSLTPTDLGGNTFLITSPDYAYVTNIFTVTSPDTTSPTAAITSAPDADQKITVTFSKRVQNGNDKSIFWVSKDDGNTWIPLSTKPTASVTYDRPTLTSVIHYPELAFKGGDPIKIMINGLLDLSGRSTTPATQYELATYNADDTTYPSLTLISADVNTKQIVLRFSEAVTNTGGQTSPRIQLSTADGVSYTDFTYTYAYDTATNQATIVASTAIFTITDDISLRLSGIIDQGGNEFVRDTGWLTSLSRLSPVSTSAPGASIVQARDGQQAIIVQFNKNVNLTEAQDETKYSVSKDNGSTWVALTTTSRAIYDSSTWQLELIINDGLNFVAGDQIKVRMSNITDAADSSLTTGTDYEIGPVTALDTTAPTATIISAKDNQSRIILQFSEAVQNHSTTLGNYALSINGSGATRLSTSNASFVGSSTVDNTVEVMITATSLKFTAGDVLVMHLDNITDQQTTPNPTIPSTNYQTASFVATDTTPPTATIVSVTEHNQQILLQFNEKLNPTWANVTSQYQVRIGSGGVWNVLTTNNSAVVYDDVAKTVLLAAGLPVAFVAGDQIYVSKLNLEDTLGNAHLSYLMGPATVSDTKPPTVTSASATESDQKIVLQFSEGVQGFTTSDFSNFTYSEDGGTTYLPMPAGTSLTYDATTFVLTFSFSSNVLDAINHPVFKIHMDNIRDMASNFTSPLIDYEVSINVSSGTVRPTATILSATDGDGKIKVQFNRQVQIDNAGTFEWPVQTHIPNFYVSVNNGVSYTQLVDPADTLTNLGSNQFEFTVTSVAITANDIIKLKMDNVVAFVGQIPTDPATGYETLPFIATDTTPPVITILSATESTQKLVLQFDELAYGHDNLANYRFSKDGGTTYYVLSAAGGSSVDGINMAGFKRVDIIVGENLNFSFNNLDSIRLKFYNITDRQTPYNYVVDGTESAAISVTDDVPPTAVITSADDYLQRVYIQWSEKPSADVSVVANYLFSVDNGSNYVPLTTAGGTTITWTGATGLYYLTVDNGIDFVAGDSIAVMVNNLKDLSGLPTSPALGYELAPYGADDGTKPTATPTTAYDNTQTLTLSWSEKVIGADNIANYILVKNGVDTPLTGATTLTYNSSSLTSTLVIEPAVGFTSGDTLFFKLYQISDPSGNQMGTIATPYQTAVYTITDLTVPTATITNASDFTNLIEMTFTEEMDPNIKNHPEYFEVSNDNGVSWQALDGTNVYFANWATPDSILQFGLSGNAVFNSNDLLRLRISEDVLDQAGNKIQDNDPGVTHRFTTDPFVALDTTPPTAEVILATDGNQTVKVKFFEDLDFSTQSISVDKNGLGTPVQIVGGGIPTGVATLSFDTNLRVYTIQITGGFTFVAGDTVEIILDNIRDIAGNEIAPGVATYNSEILAEDTTGPLPTGLTAWDTNEVVIQWDEELSSTHAEDRNNYLISVDNGVSYTPLTTSTVTYNNSLKQSKVIITDPIAITVGDNVVVRISGVKDSLGNAMLSAQTVSAVAGDGTPPVATSVVVIGNKVVVTFSEVVNIVDKTNPLKYTLESPFGTPVAITTAVSQGFTAVLSGFVLQHRSSYRVVVGSIRDASPAANTLVQDGTTNQFIGIVDGQVTLIGGDVSGGAGDAVGANLSARFTQPAGMTFIGNQMYLVDAGNHKVRKNSSLVSYTEFAGSGAQGDLLGTQFTAQFDTPMDLCHDDTNLVSYFADTGNQKIKYMTDGGLNVALLAGSGSIGNANGAAGVAEFDTPTSICVDDPSGAATTIYVADSGNHLIRAIDIGTGVTSTFAGTGVAGAPAVATPRLTAQFNTPWGIISDSSGNLYVTCRDSHVIQKIDGGTGDVTVIAGVDGISGSTDGAALSSLFDQPHGICIDELNDFLYVADRNNHKVRRIDLTNSTVSTVCGGSWGVPGTSATQSGVDVKMKEPIGVAFNTVNNKLYVTEWSNHTIREIEP